MGVFLSLHYFILCNTDIYIYPNSSALALKCDVSSAASVSSMVEKAVEIFGRIDLAVNNGI